MAQYGLPPTPPASSTYQPHYIASHYGACRDLVSDEMIQRRIGNVSYTLLADSTVTLCTVTLDTGYAVWGGSTCTDPATFDPTIGQQFAYQEAFRKLRTLFGFLVVESRHLYTANTWHLRGEEAGE